MGGPQCTSHSGLVMPPTLNFSYYFFSTSFITLSIFFQQSSLHACFKPRLDSACGGQGLHFPHGTNCKTQVPEAAQCVFFLRTSLHGLQSALLSLREIRDRHGEGGQGRLPAGNLAGVTKAERAKPRAHKLKCVFKAGFHSTHSQYSFSVRFFSFQHVLLCSMHINPLFLISMYFLISCPSLQ